MMGRDRTAAGNLDCGYRSYGLATLRTPVLRRLQLCPSCGVLVAQRVRFAAPMPVPGLEDGDGVDAMSLDQATTRSWCESGQAPKSELIL